ncbi:MAG TPA: tyrosine-type recombinase/integrase [Candidatus Pelethocola excrementipullorum]|nr:tyrosine-type recombinase/integrase [Candidatus Pelethocola excrementipullorum]
MQINRKNLDMFMGQLIENEYSVKTVEKYDRDLKSFASFVGEKEIEKQDVIRFKEELCIRYKPRSVNSILAACNQFFSFYDRPDLKVRQLKIQQEAFCPQEKVLTKEEYMRLVCTAYELGERKLGLIIQTICCTGIRVSELSYITVDAVFKGKAEVRLKGKNRTILIQDELQKLLLAYIRERKLSNGAVFVTRNGKPLDRSNIWKRMKSVAIKAGVDLEKVFPHNLRHLFAREFYKLKKDIVQLADVLGHSNINTTRIYMLSTGEEHRKMLREMDLI